jgi:hypothetical protein
MASGHLDEEPATERATAGLLQDNPELKTFLARQPIISRQFKVPYLGGISKDGRTVYIDRDLPEELPETGIAPDKYIAIHERAEWRLMTHNGMDYGGKDGGDGAHHYAVRLEHNALEEDGYNTDEYEDELARYINEDEHADLEPDDLPPDLFLGPYMQDETPLDRKLLPILKAAAIRETGRKLAHEVVRYGPGHPPEFCHNCEYSDHAAEPKCRFVQSISPDGWCCLWSRER